MKIVSSLPRTGSAKAQTDTMVRGAISAIAYATIFGSLAFWRFLRKDIVS